MEEYSLSDLKKKKLPEEPVRAVNDTEKEQREGGRRIFPFENVHVYSGTGRAELWWTDFGRLVIRTYGHDQRQLADIDAIQLITDLRLLCSKPTPNQDRWHPNAPLQLTHDS